MQAVVSLTVRIYHLQSPALRHSALPLLPSASPSIMPTTCGSALPPASLHPRTPALQRLGHEVLPGFSLPAKQQHQPRGSSERGHGVTTLHQA